MSQNYRKIPVALISKNESILKETKKCIVIVRMRSESAFNCYDFVHKRGGGGGGVEKCVVIPFLNLISIWEWTPVAACMHMLYAGMKKHHFTGKCTISAKLVWNFKDAFKTQACIAKTHLDIISILKMGSFSSAITQCMQQCTM